jgi:hypothetical protein
VKIKMTISRVAPDTAFEVMRNCENQNGISRFAQSRGFEMLFPDLLKVQRLLCCETLKIKI